MTTNNSSVKIDLSNIDGVLMLDKSASMQEDVGVGSNPTMTRWDAGRESIEAFAEELAAHDDDGITVVPFGPNFEIIDGVTPDSVAKVYERHHPNGGTYLAKPLAALVEKFLPAVYAPAPAPVAPAAPAKSGGFLGRIFGGGSSAPAPAPVASKAYVRTSPKKRVFIGILTDGAASDEQAVIDVIADATKRITSREDFGILFIQVGNDPHAAAFLKRVNDGLEGGVADFDVVAVTQLEDLEDMSCEEIINLAYTA
jgi:hypothetical protein